MQRSGDEDLFVTLSQFYLLIFSQKLDSPLQGNDVKLKTNVRSSFCSAAQEVSRTIKKALHSECNVESELFLLLKFIIETLRSAIAEL